MQRWPVCFQAAAHGILELTNLNWVAYVAGVRKRVGEHKS